MFLDFRIRIPLLAGGGTSGDRVEGVCKKEDPETTLPLLVSFLEFQTETRTVIFS